MPTKSKYERIEGIEDPTAPKTGDAQAVINAVERLAQVDRISVGLDEVHEPLLLVTRDLAGAPRVESLKPHLDGWRTQPEAKVGYAELEEVDSFVEHYNRHALDGESAIFVSSPEGPRAPVMRAVYDYTGTQDGPPRFCRYGAHYVFPLSDEWKAWTSINGTELGVAAFAEFLEDHIADIVAPDHAREAAKILGAQLRLRFSTPAEVMEASRGLTVHVKHEVAHHQNLATGECEVAFKETHEGPQGKALKVPGAFVLGIPVFRNADEADAMVARLRYRASNGRPTWTIKLHRPDQVLRTALRAVVERVAEATEAPIFWGSPEQPMEYGE